MEKSTSTFPLLMGYLLKRIMKFIPILCSIFLYLLSPYLSKAQNAPGAVQSDLALWLRSDNNLIENGGGVYTWIAINDGNMDAIQPVANDRPTAVSDEINGHKVIRFNGTSQWMEFNDATAALSGDCSIFMVVNPKEDTDVSYYLATHIGSADVMKFGHKLSGQLTYDNSIPAFWPYDMHEQKTLMAFQAETDFYLDAYVNAMQAPPWTFNFENSIADATSIGKAGGVNGTNFWKGDIAEIIIYDRFLTPSELNDVHTYLNVRYGITIPVEHHNHYSYASYPNNIAGLGMQSNQLLNQTNSRNENEDNIVRIEAPDDLDNGEYMIWGNDGSPMGIQNTEKPAVVGQRISREWRVAESSDIGLTTVSFDLMTLGYGTASDPTEFALMIDSDNGNFSNAQIHITGRSIANNEISFTGVDLQDGDWFTLAVQMVPCNTSGFSITSGTPYTEIPVDFIVSNPDPLATYTWSFTGGAVPATASGISVSTTWNVIGNYTAELTISYPHCNNFVTSSQVIVEQAVSPCVDIILGLWLEGPYDSSTDEMSIGLNSRGLLPGMTPINTLVAPTPPGQPYGASPWNYFGTEGIAWTDLDYTADAVDWVLVSFRLGTDKSTEVARAAGILSTNGEIEIEEDCILQTATSLYIVVEHRSHIAVMTANPVPIVNGEINFDFRTALPSETAVTGQKTLPNGQYGLYAGDFDQTVDQNGYDINGTDKNLWDLTNGTFDFYINTDVDLDGNVGGNDKLLWLENNGISSPIDRN